MKRWIVAALAAVLCVALAACGKDAQPSSQSEGAEPASSSGIRHVDMDGDGGGSSASSGEQSSDPMPAGESMVEGAIVDAAMNSIVIRTEDGKELSFSTEDADKAACNGLLVDSQVRIYYTGSIDGTDTSNAVVTRMEQDILADAETASREGVLSILE
ncbi:hypothetical protein H8711_08395 [Clostridiaceae bacterium NSJ-31]|uniref:DUF5666 domain-containing protein n=2 Tax=Ligaoa zhengdingensis TaxID=2763658 RepID=A0A926E0L0_9FIRM|nr:hypothetical protein [Ligaoa zhengdingensis]MBC8546952.1 hypothetical protein [Ligaoa zhengdingensis]